MILKFEKTKFVITSLASLFLVFFIGFIAFNSHIQSYSNQTNTDKNENFSVNMHKSYIKSLFNQDTSNFVAYKEYNDASDFDIRLIALYLPQFHQFKENNEWHGRGFTEWSNVTKAKPLFEGHYQPKLPIDVGFYDLTHDDVMYRQVELAKNYGINGFAFYYYWFSGKKLMEKPVYNYLNNKDLDLPFCIHWANENWSKRWDGGNREILMEQTFSEADFENFAKDLLVFFKDKRYIKINGRPLFIVYRPALFDKQLFVNFTKYLRSYSKKHNSEEPYIIATKQFNFFDNPSDWGLDAVMEFELNNIYGLQEKDVQKIDPNSDFRVFDWENYINLGKHKKDYKYKTFRTVFPRWDNSARKAYSGALVFDGTQPDTYGKWLQFAVNDTKNKYTGDERIVFINAWNEWAEGAMLEPDIKYGYAYLDMTRKVLENKINYSSSTPISGIVVLSGENHNISDYIDLLNKGKGERLFILGAKPGTTLNLTPSRDDIKLDSILPIDISYNKETIHKKAKEINTWKEQHSISKMYIVVPNYLIPRTYIEMNTFVKDTNIQFVPIVSDMKWWKSFDNFKLSIIEYVKFLSTFVCRKILKL